MRTRCINLEPWQVRAALDGRLKAVPLPVRPQPKQVSTHGLWRWNKVKFQMTTELLRSHLQAHSPIQPGDEVVGREKYRMLGVWGTPTPNRVVVQYHVDGCERKVIIRQNESDDDPIWLSRHTPWNLWKSSATMPRKFARFHWLCSSVRAVRTTEEFLKGDIAALGCVADGGWTFPERDLPAWWDRRFGKKHGLWHTGPWGYLVGLQRR